jgi:hypothetical protein
MRITLAAKFPIASPRPVKKDRTLVTHHFEWNKLYE